jgi:hypothetical protein
VGGARGLLGTTEGHNKSAKGFVENESMQQFNYNGRTLLENFDEHDTEGLEKEIEFILRNSHIGSASNLRTQTAGLDARPNTMGG